MDKLICKRVTQRLGALAAFVLLVAPGLAAQTGTIAGRVLDAGTNSPIPAAQVFIADLDLGVLSQNNGSYLLPNVPAGPRTVTVQRIGYRQVTQNVTVAAGQTAVLDFRISEEALALDEIIVTGTPGGTQRRAIGNTVTTVGVAQVAQDVAISNMQDLLAGRTPGLQYNVMNGTVGTGSPVRIRGVSSFTLGQNPIIIVDGVRVNNSSDAGPTLGSGDEVNTLDDFNPEDIESIEIIKGPAAASLYGTEATAGVIQIITKRGREGAPQFNVSIRQGQNFMRDPAGRLGTFYFCPGAPTPTLARTQAPECADRANLAPYNMYEEGNTYLANGYGGAGWETPRIYSNGLAQSYNLDVTGGTQAVRYFLSANYDNETGFVFYNNDQTFRLRGNVGVAFGSKLNLDVQTQYINGYTTFGSGTVSDGAEWQDMVWSNGYYLDRNNPFGSAGNCTGTGCAPNVRLGGFQEHLPADIIRSVEATREYTRFTGSTTLNFNSGDFNLGGMTATLTQRAVVGIDKGWDINRNVFLRDDQVVPNWLVDYCARPERVATGAPATCAPALWDPRYSETVLGEMSYERPISTNLSFDYALTAALRPNDTWGFNTSFGAQYYVRQNDNFSNSGQGFASFTSTTINQISQANISTSYSFTENKALGFYVQEEINFSDRIFLTGAIRFDDNSTFGKNAPAQKYPKVSATWVVSDESFWNFDAINSLRLRGAWGKAGRQPSALAQFNQYVVVPGAGGAPALRASSPGNAGVQAEVSQELEVGFDIALLDDRLSSEFTYYTRQNKQALLGIGTLASTGIPGSVDTNVGQMDNWGWEAQVSAQLFQTDLMTVDLDLSADYTQNEIKSLCDTNAQGVDVCFSGTDNIRIGYPYPNITVADLVDNAGFDNTLANCTATLYAAGTRCRWSTNAYGVGYYAYCDVGVTSAPGGEADPQVNMYSRYPGGDLEQCGNAVDKNLFAGRGFATHTFSVGPRFTFLEGDLQVFAMAEGQYGRVMQDSGHLWGHNYNNSAVSFAEDDAWWVAYDNAVGTGCAWDKCLFDADFWKLREVGARYNLPQSLIAKTGAERASLAFSARNVMTIWQAQKRISGSVITDPEMGNPNNIAGGGNFYAQPPLSSMNLTLRVTF
ncbi:MAG: SusC/RagA family TonB-linked outer membrane protein [Gemmatimonadales bacterium]